jgi:flagellar biosynthetic protein FliR
LERAGDAFVQAVDARTSRDEDQWSSSRVLTLQIHYPDVARYLAILLRLSLIIFLVPPFSGTQIPARIKACFVLVLTTMLFPALHKEVAPLSLQPGSLLCAVAGEAIFGLFISLSFFLILGAFELAGELISYQAGLAMAQMVDPQGGSEITILSNLLELLALLLLFALNGHLFVLKLIIESFRIIPVGQFVLNVTNVDRFILASGQLFLIAIKLAAPVAIVLFLIQIGLGVISKFVPNINILITSFPIVIIVGLFFTGLALQFWGEAMTHFFSQLFEFLRNAMQLQLVTR